MLKRYFVFVVVGDEYVRRLNLALRTYRRFSRAGLIAVVGGSTLTAEADGVIRVDLPAGADVVRFCKMAKPSLPRFLPLEDEAVYCYADADTFAVSPDVDRVFEHKRNVVNFAPDAGKTVGSFSRYAVYRGPLSRAIRTTFGGPVVPDDWPIWNGGVFLFDRDSRPFFDAWHDLTAAALRDPNWRPRDQGTLVAAAWQLGIQRAARIPIEFNWLHGLQRGARMTDAGFVNRKTGRPIHLMHFPVSYGRCLSWKKIVEEMAC